MANGCCRNGHGVMLSTYPRCDDDALVTGVRAWQTAQVSSVKVLLKLKEGNFALVHIFDYEKNEMIIESNLVCPAACSATSLTCDR